MKRRNTAEQRKKGRVPHQAVVRYSVGGMEEYQPARMFNFSSTGMYLELRFPPPKLGANLLIEVLEDGDDEMWGDENVPRRCYYAKVIWKKNLPESDRHYGVGLRYLSMT